MQFSPFTKIEPSATLVINNRALEKKAAGERVYNLSAGEPMLSTNQAILGAAKQAMEDGKTLYPPVAGISELRSAASHWMNDNYQTDYATQNTLVTCGGKFGVFALCQALLSPGDEALLASPYWVSYPQIVKLFGAIPRIIKTSSASGWKINLKNLDQFSGNNRLKVLIFNNAANPAGALYSRSEVQEILNWAAINKVVVISDEVYSGLVYDGGEYVSCGSFQEYKNNVVVVQSCSKHFAMTGWRVGLVFGPEEIIKVLTMLQSQSTTGTASVSQWAALAAFKNTNQIIPSVREAMQKRRNALIESLNTFFVQEFVPPPSSLYAFVPLIQLGVSQLSSAQFCQTLIEKYNIATVPGVAFGVEGYVRLSFGAPEEELRESVKALKSAINKI